MFIVGYGQTGPYASRPGYDVMVEAEMGLMHITGLSVLVVLSLCPFLAQFTSIGQGILLTV